MDIEPIINRNQLTFLLSLIVVGLVVFLWFVWILNSTANSYDQETVYPHVQCLSDTVLQPDGSCMSQEN